jgi:hypothetical protein
MDLDGLKDRVKSVRAPEPGSRGTHKSARSLDDLIAMLKSEDEKERQNLKKTVPLWILAAAIFVVAFIVTVILPTDAPNASKIAMRAMLAILYVSIGVFMVRRLRALSKIDYDESVRLFIEKAEKRYVFGSTEYFIFAFVITIILAYVSHFYVQDVLYRYFNVVDSSIALGITLAFFMAVYVFGYAMTKKNWEKQRSPVLEEIRSLKSAMTEEERDSADE